MIKIQIIGNSINGMIAEHQVITDTIACSFTL